MSNWVTSFFRSTPSEGKVVFFDLHTIDKIPNNSFGRQTYLLFMLFHENGYTICIKPNLRFIVGLLRLKYKKLILSFNPIFTFTKPRSTELLYLTDRAGTDIPGSILLDYAEHLSTSDFRKCLSFPYIMHPLIYHTQMHKEVARLREHPTAMRLFFGGNLDARLYDSSAMQENYGKLSRLTVVDTLRRCLDEEHLRGIRDQKDLLKVLGGKHGGFSWIANPELRIQSVEWLQVLAKCDFFLACTGVSKPMCHNCVEAMSVGTIPVLEYPEYFHPPLTDGENCLVFSGKESLIETVNKVFDLDEPAILKLKLAVIDYYETHLSPEAFGQKITGPDRGNKIAFMAHKIEYK